jgi:hypothetical protein
MNYNLTSSLCASLAAITFIVLATFSIINVGLTGLDSIYAIVIRTIPATVVMGFLGKIMGSILDSPKNLDDSDYQTDVLKALKKLDRKMTLADLNEKLSPITEEENAEIQIQAPEANKPEDNNGPSK